MDRYSTITRKRAVTSSSNYRQDSHPNGSPYSGSDYAASGDNEDDGEGDEEDDDEDEEDDDSENGDNDPDRNDFYSFTNDAYPSPLTSTNPSPAHRTNTYPPIFTTPDTSSLNQGQRGISTMPGDHHLYPVYSSFGNPEGGTCDPVYYNSNILTLGTDWSTDNFGELNDDQVLNMTIAGGRSGNDGSSKSPSDTNVLRKLDAVGDALMDLDQLGQQPPPQEQQLNNNDAPSSRTILTIEDVSSPALNDVLNVLMKNKTKFRLEAN